MSDTDKALAARGITPDSSMHTLLQFVTTRGGAVEIAPAEQPYVSVTVALGGHTSTGLARDDDALRQRLFDKVAACWSAVSIDARATVAATEHDEALAAEVERRIRAA